MNRTTLAQCQARYDNAAPPERTDDTDAIAAATDAIRDALTAGKPIDVLANRVRYVVAEDDVCDALNSTEMLAIAVLISAGDQIEAARRFGIEWARAIDKVAADNAEFRLEWERA